MIRTMRRIGPFSWAMICCSLCAVTLGQTNPTCPPIETGLLSTPTETAQAADESSYSVYMRSGNSTAPDGFAAADSDVLAPRQANVEVQATRDRGQQAGKETPKASGSDGANPIPLKPRSSGGKGTSLFGASTESEKGSSSTTTSQLVGMGGSLAAVLGLFFLFAWMLRRTAPKGQGALPKEVIETLGRAPLGVKQFVHLIRIGSKMILVSVTPDGAKTLTEITDPVEVDHLAGLCERSRSGSSSQAFHRVLKSLTPSRPSRADSKHESWEEQHA